jgi:hypothetical protein
MIENQAGVYLYTLCNLFSLTCDIRSDMGMTDPEGTPPERGYVICMGDGRQLEGPQLCPLLDEWHRQDREAQGLPPETPERAYQSFRSLPWSRRGVPERAMDFSHGNRTLINSEPNQVSRPKSKPMTLVPLRL